MEEQRYRRAVVAVELDNGTVVYQYGWTSAARRVRTMSNSVKSTRLDWVGEVREGSRYPTGADFGEAPARELTP